MNKSGVLAALLTAAVLLSSCSTKNARTDTGKEQAKESAAEITAAETETVKPENVGESENQAAEKTDEARKTAEAVPVNPVFSHDGGSYGETVNLELSLPEGVSGNAVIRYTNDGNEPTSKSPKYTEPIKLLAAKESVVVRAACFSNNGKLLGNIVTNTYIKNGERYSSSMVVSISCDDDYLYDSETGIWANPTQHGKKWERPSHVEIFTADGERVINQDAGLRIFGGSSRVLPQKSFRLVARKTAYFDDMRYDGEGKFRYGLFDNAKDVNGNIMEEFDRLVLRDGGNDSLQSTAADPQQMNMLRDGVVNNFAIETAEAVTSQASRLVTVILNGKYYGVLDLKEDINDDFISDYYGIELKDNITVIKSELDTSRHCSEHSNGGECRFCNVWFYYEVDNGEDGELEALTSLLKKACDCSSSDYDNVYREIESGIDIRNFMQYMALNLYVCNTDWPHNNVRVWRYNGESVEGQPYTDGKWRFTTRDEDFAFGRYQCEVLPEIYTMADTDTFARMFGNYRDGSYSYDRSTGYYPDSLLLQGLGSFLLKNSDFRSEFEAYCRSLVSDENIKLLRSLMEDYAEQCRPLISDNIKQLSGTIDGGYTVEKWEKAVDNMYKWLDERPGYFITCMEQALSYYE